MVQIHQQSHQLLSIVDESVHGQQDIRYTSHQSKWHCQLPCLFVGLSCGPEDPEQPTPVVYHLARRSVLVVRASCYFWSVPEHRPVFVCRMNENPNLRDLRIELVDRVNQ